jgi:uncharacterized membrane protein YtjA (UPF0391 family)
MFGWALLFLLVAVVAGGLGFFVLAGVASLIAKGLLAIALIGLVVGFLAKAMRGESVV